MCGRDLKGRKSGMASHHGLDVHARYSTPHSSDGKRHNDTPAVQYSRVRRDLIGGNRTKQGQSGAIGAE